MAKSKPKQNYHYLFREAEGPQLQSKAKFNFECSKVEDDGDGIPVQVYHLWCENEDHSDLLCDCPASYHHAHRGTCKHVGWLVRWLAIQKLRDEELQKPSNRRRTEFLNPVYYDAATDRFYPFPLHNFSEDEES